jgi:hypothetical protein
LITTSINASLVPASNVAYDLGSSSLRWRDLYLSGNTIDLGGTAIKSSANGVSFTSVANSAAAVPLTVSSLQIASATGNVVTLQATATGLQTVATSGNVVATTPGGSSGQLQYNLNGAFAGAANVVYASTGQLLRGASSARTNWLGGGGGAIGFQNEGLDAVSGSMGTVRGGVNGFPAYLIIGKTRSATVGGSDAVVNNDLIGTLDFQAADGTNMIRTAGIGAAVDGTVSTGIVPGRLAIFTANAGGVLTERVRIDSAGNFGLGVTPSAWDANRRVLQFGGNGALWGQSSGAGFLFLSNNAYYDGTNWRYLNTAASGYYTIASDGSHRWHQAASGTAGNAITFTQAMTLDASGNLGIGTNSPTYKLEVTVGTAGAGQQSIANFRTADSTASYNAGVQIFATPSATATSRAVNVVWDADGANSVGVDYFYINKLGNSGDVQIWQQSNAAMTFTTNGIERARITSGGDVGIGTNNPSGVLDAGGNTLSTQVFFRNNGTYSSGSGGQTVLNLVFGGMNVARIANTGTGQRDGTFQLLDENTIKVSISANASRGGDSYINNGGNFAIGTTTPFGTTANRTCFSVNGTTDVSLNVGSGGNQRAYLYGSASVGRLGTIGALPLVFAPNDTERASISSGGDFVVGTTSASSARLRVQGNSLQGGDGTLYRFGDQYTYKFGPYNSQVGNTGRTLFASAYDQANWYTHYLKLKIKRGYYYESGYAEYMINCQNGTVTQVSNTNSGTTTASITLSNNTVNANYRITTVSFVSPAAYNSWDFELEFWDRTPIAWTTTPSPGQIALN